MKTKLIAASILALSLTACETYAAGHAGSPTTEISVGGNTILADLDGMSLYTFDKDKKNRSNCYGGCAASWPPLFAKADASASGKLSIIKRKGGKLQWAYDGEPLYTWVQDRKSGDVTGDGVGGVWHLARP